MMPLINKNSPSIGDLFPDRGLSGLVDSNFLWRWVLSILKQNDFKERSLVK